MHGVAYVLDREVVRVDVLDSTSGDPGGHHARGDPFDDVADVPARHLSGSAGGEGGRDGATSVVPEYDDERDL